MGLVGPPPPLVGGGSGGGGGAGSGRRRRSSFLSAAFPGALWGPGMGRPPGGSQNVPKNDTFSYH